MEVSKFPSHRKSAMTTAATPKAADTATRSAGHIRRRLPESTPNEHTPQRRRRNDETSSGGANLPEELLAATGATPLVTAAGTLVPYRRSKGIYVPLLCDLGTTTVTTAIETATILITKLDLYPGKTRKLAKTYSKIAAWCADNDVDRLDRIVDDTAARLIADVAGVSDLHPQPSIAGGSVRITRGALNHALATAVRERRRIHHTHDALVSLRSATVLTRSRTRKERVTDDSLAHGLPALPCLEDRKGRPLTDEEVLLARLLVQIDLAEGALPRPLIGYLLGESGVRPLESTSLDTTDLDDRALPTTVTAPGVWNFGRRTVKLTGYAAATMPLLLPQLRRGDQPLSYDGAAPGHPKAHASLSDVIKRHLRRAGVTDPEITAKSLNLWRVHHVLVGTGNMKKARKYHGGRTINVLEDLKLTFNENDLAADRVVHLHRRDNEEHIVSVPAKSFYDTSITDKGVRHTTPRKDNPRG
jgi:hypothetical protein